MQFNILVVDDEWVWLQAVEFMLSRKGYKVTTVDCGQEALALIAQDINKFDVVLLDLMMPDMDGLEMLTALQPLLKDKKIPVIMQTGTQDDRHIAAAFQLGAVDCLRKPYNHQSLYPMVELALNRLQESV